MAWMAAGLTIFVTANLAVIYLWLCQRSLEKSLAPHREINLMPDFNKRAAVGSGNGFGSGTNISLAPRYGTSPTAAAMPQAAPAKATAKPAIKRTVAKTSAVKSPVTKKPVVKKARVAKAVHVKPAVAKTTAGASKANADKMDDVSLISGVGPILKKKLAGAGVTSLKQISKMSANKLEALDDELNLGGRCVSEEWIEQAKELIAGKPPRAKIDKAAAQK